MICKTVKRRVLRAGSSRIGLRLNLNREGLRQEMIRSLMIRSLTKIRLWEGRVPFCYKGLISRRLQHPIHTLFTPYYPPSRPYPSAMVSPMGNRLCAGLNSQPMQRNDMRNIRHNSHCALISIRGAPTYHRGPGLAPVALLGGL